MDDYSKKLTALGYHNPKEFSLKDEKKVRNLVVWLEDQKIRYYNTADREPIRDIESQYWTGALKKYLGDLKCPVENLSDKGAIVYWLLSRAVDLEFEENATEYNNESTRNESKSKVDKNSWIHSIDPNDANLIKGIEALRTALRMPKHPDHITQLQAIAVLIEQRLNVISKETTASLNPMLAELDEISLGFEVNDPAVSEAAKIVRLLQIHNLRDLQTKINQSIVAVQILCADPKTDESLGKVGR